MNKFFTFIAIGITTLTLSINGAYAEVVYFTGLPTDWTNMQDMGLIPCTRDESHPFPGTNTSSVIQCTFAQKIKGSAQVLQGSDTSRDIYYTITPGTANQAFYFSSADIHDATESFDIPSTPPSKLMTIQDFAFSILSDPPDNLTMQLRITGTITTREIHGKTFTIIYQYNPTNNPTNNPTTNFSVNTCIAQPNNQAKCCSASASSFCNT